MSQPQQHQERKLIFENKKIKDQAKLIEEQAERIRQMIEGGQ